MFIIDKIPNFKASIKFIPEKVNNVVIKDNDKMKIIIVRKYLLITS